MKKISLYIFAFILLSSSCFGQSKIDSREAEAIKSTIIGFLKWYRAESNDTTTKTYRLFKGGYPDTTTIRRIDTVGLEQYLDVFRKTQFVSENYINNYRAYYFDIDRQLSKLPIAKWLVKGPGFDGDDVLMTFEPEEILDHIDVSKITHVYVIHRKALVRLYISKYVAMVFTLTKVNNKWLIDYLGGDASSKDSLFGQ